MFIKVVDDNKSKGFTYSKLTGRLSQAIREEYYLEAMVLEYAIFEDQFSEMLKMLGLVCISNRKLVSIDQHSEAIASLIRKKLDKNNVIVFDNITCKRDVIRQLAKPNGKCPESLLVHKECILLADESRGNKKDGTRSKSLVKILGEIKDWNDARDQYIHAFYNKDYKTAMSQLPQLAEEGKKLSEELRKYTKRLKTQIKGRL